MTFTNMELHLLDSREHILSEKECHFVAFKICPIRAYSMASSKLVLDAMWKRRTVKNPIS